MAWVFLEGCVWRGRDERLAVGFKLIFGLIYINLRNERVSTKISKLSTIYFIAFD
jgi:hypothetical protein